MFAPSMAKLGIFFLLLNVHSNNFLSAFGFHLLDLLPYTREEGETIGLDFTGFEQSLLYQLDQKVSVVGLELFGTS